MDYVTNNYITLLLLTALAMLLIINRRMKIGGLQYSWAIIGIVLVITICEAVEDICDSYMLSPRILYVKTAMIYLLYPLMALLELYLVAIVKHKKLLLIPYIVSSVLVFIDLFDTRLIYYFNEKHNYLGGPLSILPVSVLIFYVMLLGIESMHILRQGERTAIVTALGEELGFAKETTETVTAAEMIIYYFFLAAINYSETQAKLYKSRIELEQQRLRLLVVQIQPHFIFNALATIQSLCYTDSEAAADCIDVFGDYLRANINSLSSDEPISFASELEHIEQYIRLEKASRDENFTVIYELREKDFKIPPLTVQPLVENAIKHGALSRRDGKGYVKIRTERAGTNIVITVTDNGVGASLTDKQKEHQSVGIENVRKRLGLQFGGTLEVNLSDTGATSVITLPG